MKTEAQIRETLNYLKQVRDNPSAECYDDGSIDDVFKSIDILRWILGERDEDGVAPIFDLFLVTLAGQDQKGKRC